VRARARHCFSPNAGQVMLRLHYVPGGHGSPVCPKRSAPWDFGNFFSVFKFC